MIIPCHARALWHFQAKHGILESPVPPWRGGGGRGVASPVSPRAQNPHAQPQSSRVEVHGVVGTLGTAPGDGRTAARGHASVQSQSPIALSAGGHDGGMTPSSIFKRIANISGRRMEPTSKGEGEAAEQAVLESAQGGASLAPSSRRPGGGVIQSPATLLESLASSPLRPVLMTMGLVEPLERYTTLLHLMMCFAHEQRCMACCCPPYEYM